MNETYNKKLIANAKNLRKNMTKEERHLWYDCLKQMPVTVHRQKVFGSYIVDFYIASANLVIELDGSQHYEDAQKKKDEEQTKQIPLTIRAESDLYNKFDEEFVSGEVISFLEERAKSTNGKAVLCIRAYCPLDEERVRSTFARQYADFRAILEQEKSATTAVRSTCF